MQTIPLADTDKYVRDSNSKAILSTDFQALKMYKAKRNQHKNMTRQFREFENDINSVKQEMQDIKSMLQQILSNQGK
jgi:hypothetical protein